MAKSDNRQRIMAYKEAHPEATVRGIQKALGLPSTSIVQHHLRMGRYAGKPYHDIVRENEALRARNKELEARVTKFLAAINLFANLDAATPQPKGGE